MWLGLLVVLIDVNIVPNMLVVVAFRVQPHMCDVYTYRKPKDAVAVCHAVHHVNKLHHAFRVW